MQNAREEITKQLTEIISNITHKKSEVKLEMPEDSKNGDYSTSVALQLSKELEKNPREIAEEIKKQFKQSDYLSRVEVAGPGFVNFYLSSTYLVSCLASILNKREKYGDSETLKDKKVMVEFTDPNPLKEFHIGHVYSNTVGESVARLFESQGAWVWRVNYQGDVGLHVAKAVWGILKNREDFKKAEDSSTEFKANFLGKAYAEGSTAYEADENSKNEIIEINKKIYAKDHDIFPIYKKAKEWSLAYFETIYKRLGTTFKRYYFESEVGPIGAELVKEHIGRVFEEEGGAVIFSKEKSGLHTRVFINSQGLPTYEAKELGLAPTKYKDFAYDTSIVITGNEINEYFKVLLKALSLVNPELADKTKHISHGMVRLPTGKMSSRTGNVITEEWLLNTAKDKLLIAFPEMDAEVSETLAVGAVKYALLKAGVGADISFSFDESISLHGNSGPYIQYSYARTQSVLAKATNKVEEKISNIELDEDEKALAKKLVYFPEIVERASTTFSPSDVCTYLFELAQAFNLFYQKAPILKAGEREAVRLALTDATGIVLQNGLNLLGIKTVEKM